MPEGNGTESSKLEISQQEFKMNESVSKENKLSGGAESCSIRQMLLNQPGGAKGSIQSNSHDLKSGYSNILGQSFEESNQNSSYDINKQF